MAGTHVQVKQYGADLIAAKLSSVARRAEDLRPAYPAVARRVAAGYERSFAAEGPGWTHLKPSTIRSRIQQGYPPGPILTRSGKYRRNASNPLKLFIDEHINSLEITIDDRVAHFHQLGTSRMVARPLKLNAGDRYWLVVEISNSLMEAYHVG